MSGASASATVPILRTDHDEDVLLRFENPGRAFANGLMLALPLWCLVGVIIWAMV